MTRALSKTNPALPYICRLTVFSRLTCPSTGPLLHRSVTAASTAAWSRRIPSANRRSSGFKDASPRARQSLSVPFDRLLLLLYRVQTRRNLFQWLSLDFLQFLVPASFVDMLQTSRCRRLSEKIGVSSRAPKKWVDPRAQAPCRANFS